MIFHYYARQWRSGPSNISVQHVVDSRFRAKVIEREASVWNCQTQCASGTQHGSDFCEPRNEIGHVFDHVRGKDIVDAPTLTKALLQCLRPPNRLNLHDVLNVNSRVRRVFLSQGVCIRMIYKKYISVGVQDQRGCERPNFDSLQGLYIEPMQNSVAPRYADGFRSNILIRS